MQIANEDKREYYELKARKQWMDRTRIGTTNKFWTL